MTELSWLAVPLAALVTACLVLVPLGAQVLARGVVFIDLAVAQVAACGVLVMLMVTENPPSWAVPTAAASAALTGGLSVWWLARRWPQQREALIGLVYVAGAGASIIAVAFDPHGREKLAALLAADVLWASWTGVGLLTVAAAGVLALALLEPEWLARDAVFYPAFALALSAAVPALGLYLVFALLIGPALWMRRGLRLPVAIGLAAAACALGLAMSWALDLPSGACLAVVLCALGLASALPGPSTLRDGHTESTTSPNPP